MMTLIVQSWWEKLLLLFKQVNVDGKREYCLTNESDSEGQSVSETYLSQVLVQVHGNVIEVNCDGKLLSTKVYVNQNTFSTSRTCCVVCCVCTIGSLRRPLSKYCVLRVWEPVHIMIRDTRWECVMCHPLLLSSEIYPHPDLTSEMLPVIMQPWSQTC